MASQQRAGTQQRRQPQETVTEQVYIAQAEIKPGGDSRFVGLQDDNGTQYSVWDNEGMEEVFDMAAESEGWIVELTYAIKGQYKNVTAIALIEQQAGSETPSNSDSGGGGSKSNTGVSIEAQCCVKAATRAVTENADLYFDDLDELTRGEISSAIGDLALDLADILYDTASRIRGETSTREVKETDAEASEPEVEPEPEADVPAEDGYDEKEVKKEEKAPRKATAKATPKKAARKATRKTTRKR